MGTLFTWVHSAYAHDTELLSLVPGLVSKAKGTVALSVHVIMRP
jgi:hypothetical protein